MAPETLNTYVCPFERGLRVGSNDHINSFLQEYSIDFPQKNLNASATIFDHVQCSKTYRLSPKSFTFDFINLPRLFLNGSGKYSNKTLLKAFKNIEPPKTLENCLCLFTQALLKGA